MWHRRQLVRISTTDRYRMRRPGWSLGHVGMNTSHQFWGNCTYWLPSDAESTSRWPPYVPFTLPYLLVFDHRYPIYGYLCVWRQSPISVGCTCREWTKTEMGYRALVCVWIRFESNISNKIWDRVRLQLSRKVNHVARLFRVLEILET